MTVSSSSFVYFSSVTPTMTYKSLQISFAIPLANDLQAFLRQKIIPQVLNGISCTLTLSLHTSRRLHRLHMGCWTPQSLQMVAVSPRLIVLILKKLWRIFEHYKIKSHSFYNYFFILTKTLKRTEAKITRKTTFLTKKFIKFAIFNIFKNFWGDIL